MSERASCGIILMTRLPFNLSQVSCCYYSVCIWLVGWLVFILGHGDYRTKAHQCLKAIGLLRVVPTTPTSNEQVKFQYTSPCQCRSSSGSFRDVILFMGYATLIYYFLVFCCCLTQSQQDSPKEEDPTS